MNSTTEVFHRAFATLEHHRGRVVWRLAPWFGVHADQIKGFPHFFKELVDVEPFVGGNGNTVRDFVYEVEFLDRNCINLVQDLDRYQTKLGARCETVSHINCWYIDPRERRE